NTIEVIYDEKVAVDVTLIYGTSQCCMNAPAQDFLRAAGSDAVDAGAALHADVLPVNALLRQYVKHQTGEDRPISGALDLGAFEHSITSLPPVITNKSLPNAIRMRWYDTQIQHAGGTGELVYSVADGNLPPGILLDPASGRIFGNARLKGTWTFTVLVTDSLGLSSTKEFTVESRLHF